MATRFIELAGEINTAMPAYVVGRVADALNDDAKPMRGSKVVILGMAYKKDVDDPRESPGFELMELLLKKGADVEYNDPHIPRPAADAALSPPADVQPRADRRSICQSRDCVLIVTDHSAYDWVMDRRARALDRRHPQRACKDLTDRQGPDRPRLTAAHRGMS